MRDTNVVGTRISEIHMSFGKGRHVENMILKIQSRINQ